MPPDATEPDATEPTPRRFPGRDGTELAYLELGGPQPEDGRPLVLLHGRGTDGRLWLDHGPAAALAARGRRVLLTDLRGHGASARPHDPAAYPPDVLVDDLLALLDHLELRAGAYDLGGYSHGGRVVLRALVRGARPGRAVVGGQGLDALTRATGSGAAYRRMLTALVAGTDLEPGSPEADQAHWLQVTGADPRALLGVVDSHVPTPAADLALVPTPVLVVVGTDDDVAEPGGAALAAALPGGEYVRVPGNHFTALGTPEFAAAVESFLG